MLLWAWLDPVPTAITLSTRSLLDDVMFSHRPDAAYRDGTFLSLFDLIQQRASAVYTFIVRRLWTALASAVVTFMNDYR